MLEHVRAQRLLGVAVERGAEDEVQQGERGREEQGTPDELATTPAGREPLPQPERVEHRSCHEDDAEQARIEEPGHLLPAGAQGRDRPPGEHDEEERQRNDQRHVGAAADVHHFTP